MKPPKFNYYAPRTVQEAVELLAGADDDAVLLTGGQSLVPMLNFRLARPSDVIDLGKIEGLANLTVRDGCVEVGAMVTHHRMEADPIIAEMLPLARAAAGYIGYRAIRNRGTIGGSIAHADPAAEWPTVLLALDGEVRLESVSGSRTVRSDDFFESIFTTVRRPDELVTSLRMSSRFARNWGFSEFQRRTGDFAAVAVAVACVINDGVVAEARIALAGVAERPVRCPAAESALVDGETDLAHAAAFAAADAFNPAGDSHGSGEYRKRLIFAETQRAVSQALETDRAVVTNA